MRRYLYFRDAASLAADDDPDSSVLVPIDQIKGMYESGSTVRITWAPQENIYSGEYGQSTAPDHVVININAGTHEEVMKSIVEKINQSSTGGFITIADDLEGEYVSHNITSVDSIYTQTIFLS